MCLYIDDESETLSSGERKARKEHRCDECRRTIKPTEHYRYWTTLYDGHIDTQKMCAHCWATIDIAADISHCPRSWYWGQVFDLTCDEGEFLGDIVVNHDLTRREHAFMRLLSYRGKRGWVDPNGHLYPIPVAA